MTEIVFDPSKPRFADANHFHPVLDFDAYVRAAADTMLLGFKVGQDTGFTDPTFADHLAGIEDRGGIALGFWFGTGQVDRFLSLFEPKEGRIPALDFEGDSLSVSAAESFVETIKDEWGRFPWFYGRSRWIDMGEPDDTAVANCPYWGPEYGPALRVPNGVGEVAAWQFTGGRQNDGSLHHPSGSPTTFSGVSGECDISMLVVSVDRLNELAEEEDAMAGYSDQIGLDDDTVGNALAFIAGQHRRRHGDTRASVAQDQKLADKKLEGWDHEDDIIFLAGGQRGDRG